MLYGSRRDKRKRIFPVLFDGKSEWRIVPAFEGLIYPYMMWLGREMSEEIPGIRDARTRVIIRAA